MSVYGKYVTHFEKTHFRVRKIKIDFLAFSDEKLDNFNGSSLINVESKLRDSGVKLRTSKN